jgi:tetratricopeptide (TPR) repeat protein
VIRVVKESNEKVLIKLWDNSEMHLPRSEVERVEHFDTPSSYKLGRSEMQAGNYKKAAAHFKKVKLTGAREWLKVYTLHNLGQALLKVGLSEPAKNDEAAQVYAELLKKYPKNIFRGEALLAGAVASFQKGEYTEAKKKLKKLLDTVPPATEEEMLVRLWKARVYEYGDKNYNKAKTIYRQIGTTGTPRMRAKAQLGEVRCLQKMNDPRSAIAGAERLLEKTKDRTVVANLWTIKGDSLLALAKGKPDKVKDALFAYLRVVVVYFYDARITAEAAFKAGQCFEKIEQTNRAIELYNRAKSTPGGGDWSKKAADRLTELG